MLKYHILEFNPKYTISNKGFIISLIGTFHILNPRYDGGGYIQYYIRDISTSKRKDYKAHRLVAETFIPNPNNLPCVNHIDGNKRNNHVENLEWITYTENNLHAYKTGLTKSKYKPCIINGIVYKSQTHAAKHLGVSRKTIYNLINKQ